MSPLRFFAALTALGFASACSKSGARKHQTLSEARSGFKTELENKIRGNMPVPFPQMGTVQIYYDAPGGKLPAFVTADPKDSKRHPLIIWLTGGFSNSIGDEAWTSGPPENDQTASAFRKAGVITMYPCRRGGNMDKGHIEGFLGEVDDVIAAAKAASQISWVDPKNIYLGGHSTGGTLALLVAEKSSAFRAVFAFGPVAEVSGYASRDTKLPFNHHDDKEVFVRSPVNFLSGITSPVWVIEGDGERSNAADLEALKAAPHADSVQFLKISGADHFSVLDPANRIIAQKILTDWKDYATAGKQCAIKLSADEIRAGMKPAGE